MSAVQRLSWGRYPAHPQTLHAVHWRCDLPHTLSAIVHTHSTTLPFGNGRSYGDSCQTAASYCASAQSQRAYAADRNANGQREAFEDALDSAPTINAEKRSCRNPEDCAE